jgi:hypothetical protein
MSLFRLKEGSSKLCDFGWLVYSPSFAPLYRGCLPVAKVGLGVQRISGGPEVTDWESKINV